MGCAMGLMHECRTGSVMLQQCTFMDVHSGTRKLSKLLPFGSFLAGKFHAMGAQGHSAFHLTVKEVVIIQVLLRESCTGTLGVVCFCGVGTTSAEAATAAAVDG